MDTGCGLNIPMQCKRVCDDGFEGGLQRVLLKTQDDQRCRKAKKALLNLWCKDAKTQRITSDRFGAAQQQIFIRGIRKLT